MTMMRRISTRTGLHRLSVACALAACIAAATPAHAQTHAEELAKQPGVIFARALEDVPGTNLVVVALVSCRS